MRSSTEPTHPRRFFRLGRALLAASFVLMVGLSATKAHALELGEPPPPIDLPDRDGTKVDLGALVGKVVLVDFWASWCGPCKKEMRVLQALHQRHGPRGLVVLGVNIDRNEKKLEGFLEDTPVTFRIVHDRQADVASRYDLSIMPSTFFVDRAGKLRYVHEGFEDGDADVMERRIRGLLDERVEETGDSSEDD